ncbi:MAG TPA: hypothetical protein VLH84_01445 [Patescibacteria group bacterium]|nr:hypothetical protein [Patescibacteria group bacterium]
MYFVRRPIAKRFRVHFVALSVATLLVALGMSTLNAQGVSSIAQGFQTKDPNVVSGALVSLANGSPNTIELSTADKVEQMLGVAGTKSLIELNDGTGTVQVVTSGNTQTLVSDINGTVKAGDRITASPIAGVGMKATTSSLVIGTATQSLSSVKTSARNITSNSDKSTAVKIGSVEVQVDRVFYQAPNDQGSFLPSSVQSFANSVVGHEVAPVRIVLAGLMVVMLFVIVIVVLYSTVKSSIISIGRNPLSENAVHRSLLEVGVTVLGTLVFTVVVVYLILVI